MLFHPILVEFVTQTKANGKVVEREDRPHMVPLEKSGTAHTSHITMGNENKLGVK